MQMDLLFFLLYTINKTLETVRLKIVCHKGTKTQSQSFMFSLCLGAFVAESKFFAIIIVKELTLKY